MSEEKKQSVTGTDRNYNEGPFPDALVELVAGLTYRRGWNVYLRYEDRGQGCKGLTLIVTVRTVNSYNQDDPLIVRHLFPVPPAAYNRRSWQRWLFEQLLLVERHEAMEFFTIEGKKPFAPHHGPGEDPYTVYEHGSDLDVRTSFRGEVND